MTQFQTQLSGLMSDAGYKSLKPEEQMFAISELTHWWSLWFSRIPEPSRELTNDFLSVEQADFENVNLAEINPKEFNWYAYLMYVTNFSK